MPKADANSVQTYEISINIFFVTFTGLLLVSNVTFMGLFVLKCARCADDN